VILSGGATQLARPPLERWIVADALASLRANPGRMRSRSDALALRGRGVR
jgi:hypothetical protein